MKDTTNKIQYQYDQLVGQLIKLPLSFTHINFFYVILVESSICCCNYVSVVLIKTNLFYLLRLDLDTTTSTTLQFYRV